MHENLPFGPPLTREEQEEHNAFAKYRRERRIVFERGAFRFYVGERLSGIWWPGILEKDPQFAEKALRWLAKGRIGREGQSR